MSEARQRIQYGTTIIEYDLAFVPRKTLSISVDPDLRVSVTAPPDTNLEHIAASVRKRAPWIMRQQRELEQYLPKIPPRQYLSGETHRYLGRQYRLNVIAGQPEVVKLARGWLSVVTSDKHNQQRVQQLVEEWYQHQAERVFPERLQAMLPRFQHLNLAQPALRIKELAARWGSCSGTGVITLNRTLMQMPKPCIEYVIVHELCHLVEHNHSPRFYAMLDQIMPDWRERRQRLNTT